MHFVKTLSGLLEFILLMAWSCPRAKWVSIASLPRCHPHHLENLNQNSKVTLLVLHVVLALMHHFARKSRPLQLRDEHHVEVKKQNSVPP